MSIVHHDRPTTLGPIYISRPTITRRKLQGGPGQDEDPGPEHHPHQVDLLHPGTLLNPHPEDVILCQLHDVAATAADEPVLVPAQLQAAARVADLGAAQSQQVGPGDGHSQPVNLVDPVWKTLEHKWKRGSWRHGIESRHPRNYRTGYNCMSLYTLKKYIKSKIG